MHLSVMPAFKLGIVKTSKINFQGRFTMLLEIGREHEQYFRLVS